MPDAPDPADIDKLREAALYELTVNHDEAAARRKASLAEKLSQAKDKDKKPKK